MFNNVETAQLNDAIIRLHNELVDTPAGTDEYSAILKNLDQLYKIKNETRSNRVKPDTIAMVGGNLAGILMIVGHERANVVTSKALSFITKLR